MKEKSLGSGYMATVMLDVQLRLIFKGGLKMGNRNVVSTSMLGGKLDKERKKWRCCLAIS